MNVLKKQREIAHAELAERADSIEARRKEAIAKLGDRYLLHPKNRVQRLDRPRGNVR
jgi:hypothetical protein